MANPEHLAKLKEGVKAWNHWREDRRIIPDLTGALLVEADLDRAKFGYAELAGAKLSRTKLKDADFSGANLSGADLSGANLGSARLANANLTRVDLSGADLGKADLSYTRLGASDLRRVSLSGANLRSAELAGSDLSGAYLAGTVLVQTDLSKVQGLESIRHFGPSVIDYQTLARSGPLPLAFLRGCGLPDQFIDYIPSLFTQAVQFYSCFISYSTKDQEFADRLYADLQAASVRCWFAPHNIQGGKKIHDQIDEAIRLYDRLVLILSEASMNSEWVKTEIAHARQKEVNQKRQVLFPLSLVEYAKVRAWKCPDGDTGKDSAREIREYFIPDFSMWKDHDSYQAAFKRLLRDLTAKAEGATA